MTWQQVMLEWQRDWARKDTYDAVMAIEQADKTAVMWALSSRTDGRTPDAAATGHRDLE
jgi:hypothetical protein